MMKEKIEMFALNINIRRAFIFVPINEARRGQMYIGLIEMDSLSDISVKPIVQHVKKGDITNSSSTLRRPQTNTDNSHATPHQSDL